MPAELSSKVRGNVSWHKKVACRLLHKVLFTRGRHVPILDAVHGQSPILMPQVHFQIETAPPRVLVHAGGEMRELPALWLREHCQDAAHVDPDTQQRLFDPHRLSEDIVLTDARTHDEDYVNLTFSDGYSGRYRLSALTTDFDLHDGCPEPLPWQADMNRQGVTFDWPSLSDTQALRAAAGAFLRYGFIILRTVPTAPQAILDVARTFGPPRETNFGRYFEV